MIAEFLRFAIAGVFTAALACLLYISIYNEGGKRR